ncbi:succinate dehydrogenase cytochrome b560 subunit [Russula earlei]|uniref:Succinate dehydrogenase cytochrome b560 subunit n=1 Tax=Russula earlei TaxID=71964 RepID=A0ACC0U0Z8_9AGAM|nr:succinate dehydrogenase cytochrome b560 subunit [Russula earlei]
MIHYTRALGLGSQLTRTAFSSRIIPNTSALRSAILRRHVQTNSLKPEEAIAILNTQRLARPSSPHFTIYQPQLTWIASIANRITGAGLSVLLYGFSLAYLFAPSTFSSTNIIEFAAGLPEWVKVAEKAILAAPFAFHSLNGLRHLAWDTGYCLFPSTLGPNQLSLTILNKVLSLKGVYRTGYAVLGASAITTVALVLL